MAQKLSARLYSCPLDKPTTTIHTKGIQHLNLKAGLGRDGLVYIPQKVNPFRASPLLVLLHGAGGEALQIISPFQDLAERTGTILLAPESREHTWDIILAGFGPDIEFLDRALEWVFSRYCIDQNQLGIAGFSDGASYALSAGMTNGQLFSNVMAFSPGFVTSPTLEDSPPVFMSHGQHDEVLPIDDCSRRIAAVLEDADVDLIYQEFDGGHGIPAAVARFAFDWFLGQAAYLETRMATVPTSHTSLEGT